MDGTPYVCMYASRGPRDRNNADASGGSQATQGAGKRASLDCKFVMPQKKPKSRHIPKVAQMVAGPAPVPPAVLSKLAAPTLVMGFDVETNDFAPGKRPLIKGQFGHWSFCTREDFNFNIVQIGFAIGATSEGSPLEECKERLVLPEGYAISAKATDKHGITTERALREGLPMRDVLAEFMSAAIRVRDRGGRLVAHHCEFDAGVIARHLRDNGYDEWGRQWKEIATEAICTMDLDTWEWLHRTFGREREQGEKTLVMGLKDAVKLVLSRSPEAMALLQEHHTAGADAQMHRLLYIAFRTLASKC